MSAANVEVVRAQYEAWKRGEYREALAAYDEAVQWDATHFPDGQIYEGHEGVQRFMGRWIGTWDGYELIIERYLDAGDEVVIYTRESGRAKASGIEVEHLFGHVFTLRDGKIVRWRGFSDRQDALEAAGLSDSPG